MKWLKDYFYLNSREEKGIIVLLSLVIFLFILQYLWIYILPLKSEQPADITRISRLNLTVENNIPKQAGRHLHPHNFDPNNIDEKELLAIGLPENVVKHIVHYRDKGGQFKTPNDFQKIYGLSDSDFEALKPWLQFTEMGKKTMVKKIDLNTADSIQLLTVKGIGPVLTHRILYMRSRLKSFMTTDQLLDIYGIDQEKFEFIRTQVMVSKQNIHRLNINTSSLNDLKNNPYIRYKLADIIIKYRELHGPYKSVDDLKKILAIDEKLFNKIVPYIETNN